MAVDTVLASRVQFGLTLAFHYLFAPVTIGLSIALDALNFVSDVDR